jgi:nucleoside-diphosphate-sugar epimerase
VGERIIVAGALGLIGRAVVDHCERLGWDVIGLSRRKPDFPTRSVYVDVDLSNETECRAKLSKFENVTRVVYCALFEKPDLVSGWSEADHSDVNVGMLRNLLDVVERANPKLQHISLMQGAKAYGIHLGPSNPPARERSPRHMHPNFYWAQEDLVRARSRDKAWRWTIFRPQIVLGLGIGSAMNVANVIGVYAAVSRELGLPLIFPGTGYDVILEATDTRLLARAIAWAGTVDSASDQVFNVTNGDVFTWRGVWPLFAKRFKMGVGLPQPMPLAKSMADKAALWSRIVEKFGLRPYGLDNLIGPAWQAADFSFSDRHGARAQIMSTIKIRQAGFADCIDTEEAFDWWLGELQRQAILPT